jgi:hypothetical protein
MALSGCKRLKALYPRKFAGMDVAQFLFCRLAHSLCFSMIVADFYATGLPVIP